MLNKKEKNKIVNELYKIKAFNRLLKSLNIEFNQYFNKILYSTINPSITFEPI
jgi:hypothetical protein